jgi:hypothetical protein
MTLISVTEMSLQSRALSGRDRLGYEPSSFGTHSTRCGAAMAMNKVRVVFGMKITGGELVSEEETAYVFLSPQGSSVDAHTIDLHAALHNRHTQTRRPTSHFRFSPFLHSSQQTSRTSLNLHLRQRPLSSSRRPYRSTTP